MKVFPISLLLFLILTVAGCKSSDDSPSTNENCVDRTGDVNIMPLGASRVAGSPPGFESYRYELWKKFIDGGWSVDFVGTEKDAATYNSYKGFCFDTDHEGRSGWTSAQINENIENWLDSGETPDIVLFSSPGGNDALKGDQIEDIVPRINAIIDKIQTHNPNVTIVIEQMAPLHSSLIDNDLRSALTAFRTIIESIAKTESTPNSEIVVVDMATGFLDHYYADGLHYNNDGALFVAERYYNILIPLLQ